MYHVYFAVLCLVYGSNFILMDRATTALGPVEIAFWRVFGGGLVLALWWRLSSHRTIPLRYWPHMALVALLGNVFPFTLQPLLMARGFAHSYFGMLMAFVPLLTLLFSIPMLGVWPRWQEFVGVLGGLGALVVLLREGQSLGMSAATVLLSFCVPVAYAVSNTYIRKALSDVPALPLTTAIMFLGAMFLLPLLLVPGLLESFGMVRPADPVHWSTALASIAWLAAIGTGISTVVFLSMIHARGPLFAGMVTYPIPLVALAWGAYDREPITGRQLAAMVVVLAMVALAQYGGVTRKSVEPSKELPGGDAGDPQLARTTP